MNTYRTTKASSSGLQAARHLSRLFVRRSLCLRRGRFCPLSSLPLQARSHVTASHETAPRRGTGLGLLFGRLLPALPALWLLLLTLQGEMRAGQRVRPRRAQAQCSTNPSGHSPACAVSFRGHSLSWGVRNLSSQHSCEFRVRSWLRIAWGIPSCKLLMQLPF